MKTALAFLLVILAPFAAAAAEQGTILHKPDGCLKSDEFLLLTAQVTTRGVPRVYFRREGNEDWCWVDGTLLEDKAIFVLPRFQKGVTLEYYFLTLLREQQTTDASKRPLERRKPLVNDRLRQQTDDADEAAVTGKSPDLYHVPVTDSCTTEGARHVYTLTNHCGPSQTALLFSMAYELGDVTEPPVPSPSVPRK